MIIRRNTIFNLKQICFVDSSQVMTLYGFLSTSWKPSTRGVSRSLQCHRDQKKARKVKSCWSYSLMWKASSTVSSYHKARQSINKSIKKSFDVCFTLCIRRDGVVAGQIIAALQQQCPCLQHPEYQAVSGQEDYCHIRTTSLFTWSCFVWLFSFPQA